MQKEDVGLWVHGVIVKGNSAGHSAQSYKVCEGDKDRQTYNMQHKAYQEDTNNDITVPQRADHKRNLVS